MNASDKLATLQRELGHELTEHLLPYWSGRTLDVEHDGFVGRITQDGHVISDAPKGSVLNARILWTFSAAALAFDDSAYLRLSDRAHRYLRNHFWDDDHGGLFWTVDRDGSPLDTTKKIYAQAFGIYGLTERFKASGLSSTLDEAIALFQAIESHGRDRTHSGYFESFSREWGSLDDVRLSEADDNAPKSMNTQLHVLEAYTNLYQCWPAGTLKDRMTDLVETLLEWVYDPVQRQMRLFFEADWTPRSSTFSYGHDIEASWLLLRAVDELDAPGLQERTAEAAAGLADAVLKRGQDDDGGIFWKGDEKGPTDTDKHWWPQAEAVLGFVTAFRGTGDERFLDAAVDAWTFTREHVIDSTNGEWLGRLARDGVPYADEDKVGLWKCPYHNVRACLEVVLLEDELPDLHTK